jgi:hypothetical protein
MNKKRLFIHSQERQFFAHHMLLHASDMAIKEAESAESGQFNKCLSAMVMISISVEALLNAVGSIVTMDEWPSFERLPPHEKIDSLVNHLGIIRDAKKHPWPTLRHLGSFRNKIVHAKPEPISKTNIVPIQALTNNIDNLPESKLEKEITLGNAKNMLNAVQVLKEIFVDALPEEKRYCIKIDMWSGSTTLHKEI